MERTNGTLEQVQCVLRIDANGYMVSEKVDTGESVRILLLGGSAVENLYVAEPRRIATRIENIVSENGKDAKVYGAGISNTDLLQMINTLLNKGVPLRPHVVVYCATIWPDLIASELEASFWNPSTGPIRTYGQEPCSPQDLIIDGKRRKAAFDDQARLLRLLCDICSGFDMALFMATWPIYEYDEFAAQIYPSRSVSEEERKNAAAINGLIREVCSSKGCTLIDLERQLKGLTFGEYFYDLAHPNARGCETIASFASEVLLAHL
jgi:hypothetical protein